MWEQLNRVIKDNGAIVLYSAQPFTSTVIRVIQKLQILLVWLKNRATGVLKLKNNL